MEQGELIHEDWRDALRHVVKALGGMEAVGIEIWPGKTRKAAGAWLSDCLNHERPAKLDLEELQQLLQLAREKGIHLGLYFLCDDLGYSHPSPTEPLDQEAEIARQIDGSLDRLQALAAKLERIQRRGDVSVLRGKAG